MSKPSRYVAIVECNNKINRTYVFDGNVTLDDLFAQINERLFDKVKSCSIHRDEMLEPTFAERVAEQVGGSCNARVSGEL
jgi:hypothetical protein